MIDLDMSAASAANRYVRVRPGSVELVTESPPQPPLPGPGEALIDVLACGICGTDLHMWHGMRLPAGAEYPVRPGHEVAGLVRSLGNGADGQGIAAGDLVVLHPVAPCGACGICRSGSEQLCPNAQVLGIHRPGGLADTVSWPVRRMVAASGLAPTRAAVLADAVATAYRAVRQAELPAGGRACVIGAGGVGMHVLELLRAADPGARLVGIVSRASSAQRLATAGYDAEVTDDTIHRRLRERFGGFDAVFDFSGQPASPRLGIRLLDRRGVLVLGSVLDGDLALGQATTIQTRELAVRGVFNSSLDDLRSVVELARSGRLNLSGSVSHVRPLSDAVAAFAELDARPEALTRMVLTTSDIVA
jgi:2-desacetyl-2-hydroxyethyl bacteriochlorophyllide A dehydrogenase